MYLLDLYEESLQDFVFDKKTLTTVSLLIKTIHEYIPRIKALLLLIVLHIVLSRYNHLTFLHPQAFILVNSNSHVLVLASQPRSFHHGLLILYTLFYESSYHNSLHPKHWLPQHGAICNTTAQSNHGCCSANFVAISSRIASIRYSCVAEIFSGMIRNWNETTHSFVSLALVRNESLIIDQVSSLSANGSRKAWTASLFRGRGSVYIINISKDLQYIY